VIQPSNSNDELPQTRDFDVARGAGGLSMTELRRKGFKEAQHTLDDTHWLDEHTDLWIPRGVLLCRPWRNKKKPKRDEMQLEC
jgi:hypothetical protein